jgi:hopanoid biosynthesis associated protein HpnK
MQDPGHGHGVTIAVRQLAITADDFGASARINAAVVRAARDGVLTGTSWMAGGAAADEALALVRGLPRLALGVHLTCVMGRAVLPPRLIPDLVDHDGRFPRSPTRQGLRLAASRASRVQLRDELRAQIERCLGAGCRPRHLDAHLDFHVHPAVFPVVAALAREYGVAAVRVPRDPLRPALAFDRRHAARKLTEAAIFALLCRRAVAVARSYGVRVADRVYGHHQTGAVDEAYLLDVIARLPAGVSELYCHPGAADGQDDELAALLSPRVRGACDAAGIDRRHYDG